MDFRKISRYVALAAMAAAMFAVVACGDDEEASSSAADEPAELVPVSAQATVSAPAVAPSSSSDDSSDSDSGSAAAEDSGSDIMMGVTYDMVEALVSHQNGITPKQVHGSHYSTMVEESGTVFFNSHLEMELISGMIWPQTGQLVTMD